MKKAVNFSLIVLFAGLIFASCSKSTDETSTPQKAEKHNSPVSIFQTPAGNASLAKIVTKYMEQNPMLKSSEFMIPLFTSEGFGVAKDLVVDCSEPPFCFIISGQIGFFNAAYGPNDFWRMNPDGTISVHLSSNNAFATLFNFDPFEISDGDRCHMTMNYTGNLIEETFVDPDTGEVFTYYWIDTENSPSAVSFQGNGKVQLFGAGPKMNIVAHVTKTPGGQSNIFMNVN